MKKDFIPTVKSLIDQGAIAISGDPVLIERFSRYVFNQGLHFDKSQINFDPDYYACFVRYPSGSEKEFQERYVRKLFEKASVNEELRIILGIYLNEAVDAIRYLDLAWFCTQSGFKGYIGASHVLEELEVMAGIRDKKSCYYEPTQLLNECVKPVDAKTLYSLELGSEIVLTCHTHSRSGIHSQVIYRKQELNIKKPGNTFRALYSRLDNSSHFFICQACQKLVAREWLDTSGQPICADGDCNKSDKQDFDVSMVDRATSSQFESVRALKTTEDIKVFSEERVWHEPHESHLRYEVKASLPLSTSVEQVRQVQAEFASTSPFPAPCHYCRYRLIEGEGVPLSSFVEDDTNAVVCYGCTTSKFGVMY